MSFWLDLRKAIRHMMLVQERVERLSVDLEKVGDRLVDHDRRLTRIETLVAVAHGKPPPPVSGG